MPNQTKSIALNTGVQLIGKAISTILGLIAIAIMTRYLGAEKYGWYATSIGFLQFLGMFMDFGFTVVSAKMLSEPAFDKQQLTNNLFTWRLITAVISQGILPLSIFLFPYPLEIKLAVVLMSLSFIGVSLGQIFIARLQTRLQIYWQSTGEVLGRIALVAGIIFIVRGHGEFLGMMGVITFASLLYTVFIWIKSSPYHLTIDKTISGAIFHKIWPTALSVLLNSIYLQGDRLLLPLYVPQTEVGFYTAGYRVLDILVQIMAMLIGIMMPLITFAWSRQNLPDFKKHFQRAFDIMSLVIIPMVFGVFVLATPIMTFIAGQEFSPSGKILQLLILAMMGTAFGMVFGHVNLAIDQQKQSLWAYAVGAVVGLSGYLLLMPRMGVWGAVYTTIFTEILCAIILAIMAIYYSRTFPKLWALGKILLASGIMGLIIYFVQLPHVIFSILLGGIVYTILILLFRVISTQTLQEIFKK
jgi:O-antigen/teichoic acid export membrane protein